jgi:hypothetical protein
MGVTINLGKHKEKNSYYYSFKTIVIKPSPGIDLAEEPGLGFYGSTRVNPGQPKSTRKLTHFSFF